MRGRMAGPESGLFFPIRPNKMLWRMKGGDNFTDKLLARRLSSVQRGKRALHANSATGSE